MKTPFLRATALAMTTLAVLAVAGCVSATPHAASPMGDGVGHMDGSSYHYSTATCLVPSSPPGRTVNVVLADMGMTQMMSGTASLGMQMMLRAEPATVVAGQVTLVARNMGWRTHELVVMPLAPGATSDLLAPGPDGKVDETGSVGEASANCAAGTGEGIEPGSAGWITLTLAPGRYELICNLTNHYADGMHQELIVT